MERNSVLVDMKNPFWKSISSSQLDLQIQQNTNQSTSKLLRGH